MGYAYATNWRWYEVWKWAPRDRYWDDPSATRFMPRTKCKRIMIACQTPSLSLNIRGKKYGYLMIPMVWFTTSIAAWLNKKGGFSRRHQFIPIQWTSISPVLGHFLSPVWSRKLKGILIHPSSIFQLSHWSDIHRFFFFFLGTFEELIRKVKWKPWVFPQRRLDRNLRKSRTIVNLYPRNVCSRQCICINVISAYTVDIIYGYVTINIISIIITILIGCIWSINEQSNLYVLTQVHLVHALSWLVNRGFWNCSESSLGHVETCGFVWK